MLQDEINKALSVLRNGGIILYPTDTIWGIGCDATNPQAVARIYEIKKRADSKAMICLVDSPARFQRYVRSIPDAAYDMMELSTKPLTIIFDNASSLAHNVIAEDGSIGIRVTNEEFSHQLCYKFQKPIVATSANISGSPSPKCFADISQEIKAAVDHIVHYSWQSKEQHQPSSIIKIKANGEFCIVRQAD